MSGFLSILANSISIAEGNAASLDMIKIIPLGLVNSQKGNFSVDEESFNLMRNYFSSREIDIVVDYEHQTTSNSEAPAAGWIKDLHMGYDGIYGKVEWTARAYKMIQSKEYRYLSPVVLIRDSDRKVVRLHSVALTNTPAIDKMTALINSTNFNYEEGDASMTLLEQLIELLGLDQNVTEQELITMIKGTLDNKGISTIANKATLDMLGLDASAKPEEVTNQIYELKNSIKNKEIEDSILYYMKEGKLTAYQKEVAYKMAHENFEVFKAWMDKAPMVVPMGEIAIDTKKSAFLSDTDALLGLSHDDIVRYGK